MQILEAFLQEHFTSLITDWQTAIADSWRERQNLIAEDVLNQQCSRLLEEIIAVVPLFNTSDLSWEPPQDSGLITMLQEVGNLWAHQGLRATETTGFIIALKYTVSDRLEESFGHDSNTGIDLKKTNDRLMDRLLIVCHEAFTRSREKLIKQQSHALLELSSPVVKMWQRMLLVPLIGVIDTTRARQITESLLSEIAKQEALVTIIELTGVPVFDTAVAGHLMKTIKAAQMLGCRVLMTGISPEGAMVLTKLGIDFHDVITRGNLHSGVCEGFRMLNLAVTSSETASHGA